MSLMLGKKISWTGKTSDVRYITLLYEGSHEGMDGIAHYVRARSPINLRLRGRAAGMPMRLPLAAQGRASTLKHTLSALQTSHKSTLSGPQRHVDHSMTLEFVSSSATELTSAAILASPKRKTRADRSFRSRDTISGHMSDHEEAHGGWRRTG